MTPMDIKLSTFITQWTKYLLKNLVKTRLIFFVKVKGMIRELKMIIRMEGEKPLMKIYLSPKTSSTIIMTWMDIKVSTFISPCTKYLLHSIKIDIKMTRVMNPGRGHWNWVFLKSLLKIWNKCCYYLMLLSVIEFY